jgi:hypothetical protein
MRRKLYLAMYTLLIAALTSQATLAAGRHHSRRAACMPASASQQTRNAYGAMLPSGTESDREYWQGRGFSAPAGR